MADENKDKEKKDSPDNYWGSGNNNSDRNRGHNQSNGPEFRGPRNKWALIAFCVLIAAFLFLFSSESSKGVQSVPYTSFLRFVENGSVAKADIKDSTIINFTLVDGQYGQTRIPYLDSALLETLRENGVQVTGSEQGISALQIILQLLPWIIFIALMITLMRQTGVAGGSKLMGDFGKSHARKYEAGENKVTFADVAGQEESKYELMEIVDFLKNPEKYSKMGARIPRGVLLVGPPGTGKTLIARAVAGESGAAFLYTSGSDFVEMFVGMGAARVRDLFKEARDQKGPCIIFIDELDAVGRTRGSGLGGGHDEREQTLNQMLVEMDGFSPDKGIIVMAATNRPDVLDPALLRPGRFDRQVVVDLPDVQERDAILKIHFKKVKFDEENVDTMRIARATPGTSGADLANLVNEAALLAVRAGKPKVTMEDVEQARDKLLLGVARKSRYMTADEKTATAYHEAGHTLLHYYLKNLDPLHKVTIIPHGRALGITMSLPEKDAWTKNRNQLEDWIKVCMGGYVAEDLVYGVTTTGVSNDIKQATDIARKMVTEYGMSELGFIALGSEDEPLFLGREIAQHKNFSEEMAKKVDEQIDKILGGCMKEVRSILSEHRDQLDLLTQKLVEKETMDDAEIRELLGFPELSISNAL